MFTRSLWKSTRIAFLRAPYYILLFLLFCLFFFLIRHRFCCVLDVGDHLASSSFWRYKRVRWILKPSNLCALSRRPFSLGTLPSSRDGWFFAARNPSSMILTNSFSYFFLVYVVLHSPLLFHRRFVVERTFDFALNRNAYVISRLLAPSSLASEIATIQLFAVVKVVHLVIKPWFHTACILFSEMHWYHWRGITAQSSRKAALCLSSVL